MTILGRLDPPAAEHS